MARANLRRPWVYQFAVLAVVCTVGIFLFPVASGPYASVHGPASALRAMRAWMLLLAVLTLAFTRAIGLAMGRSWSDCVLSPVFVGLPSPSMSSVLRC